MTATLQELRPTHGKGIKKNPWPGVIGACLIVAVVMWAIASGLANSTIQLLRGNLQAAVVHEEVKQNIPPPPPPPDFKPPPVVAIQQEVTVDLAQAPPAEVKNTITNTPPPPPPKVVAEPPPPPPPPPTPPSATTSHAVTADDYPAISLRLQEQGIVAIKYIIGPDGSVSDCTVTTSSGKPRLDDAACTMVKKRWKFKPATQGGKPVTFSNNATVTFKLQ